MRDNHSTKVFKMELSLFDIKGMDIMSLTNSYAMRKKYIIFTKINELIYKSLISLENILNCFTKSFIHPKICQNIICIYNMRETDKIFKFK